MLGPAMAELGKARDALVATTMHYAKVATEKPALLMLNASPLLELFGTVTVGWLLLEQATIAWPRLEALAAQKGVKLDDAAALAALCQSDDDARFYAGKVETAKFYAARAVALVASKAEVLRRSDGTELGVVL
ncbi:MAG: acyl-CoA dehydrogenase C-terminal domain-containing protein [Myxococcales bacterium]|nr:acyl-CoA dehydrogenase C-terminal domain-containing protein [Myxococcales bacterium]